MAETQVSDEGCIQSGPEWDYQMVYRIVIWDDNTLSYMEEVPCGSGKWYERPNVSAAPPAVIAHPGVFTSSGTIEFAEPAGRSGTITEGSGPDAFEFIWAPESLKLIISAPVAQSLLNSLR